MSYKKSSEVELQAFAARLNEICDDMGIAPKFNGRQAELASAIQKITGEKITPNAARKWVEGEGFPSTDKIILLARWASVNTEWFITGQGSKASVDYTKLEPKIDAVVKIMQEMSEYQKEQAVRLIDAIAEPAPHSNGSHKSA